MFDSFVQTSAISDETIARYKRFLPEEIVRLWREDGVGLIGDGFARSIDPNHTLKRLSSIVSGLPSYAIPVFSTALADLFVYMEPFYLLMRFRFGMFESTVVETTDFLDALTDADFCDRVLGSQPYSSAVERFGVPSIDECFGYRPTYAPDLRNVPPNLELHGFWEHLADITKITGPPIYREMALLHL